MSAKTFMTLVVLGTCVLVAGCGSDSVSPTGGAAPILPPQNVKVVTQGMTVVVSWDESSQSNLLGYNVYRLNVDTQSIQTLTQAPIPQNMYADNAAQHGVRYEYRVTAVGASGQESGYSAKSFEFLNLPSDKRDRKE